MREAGRRTFRAISVRNYRLYFTGQVISVSGTWMQTVSQAYLILFPLHGTGVDVAIATSLQFLPLLLLGPFGGLIADRLDKRKVLYATQGTAGILALILGVLVVSHSVSLWEVYALAAGLGFVNLFDNPARQTFVSEMVGLDLLPNAVSLNSVLMNSARVIGPAIGGVLIITVGVATCFFLNAASYAAVIVALAMMRAAELYRRPGVARAKGQVREGLRYVWSTPDLKMPLLAMAVVGVFAFNFTVTLPLLAKFTFHGGGGLYSWFMVAMGAGAVAGGLFTAFRSRPSTAAARLHRPRLRHRHPGRRAGPLQDLGHRPAGSDGCGQHLLRRHRQRHPAAAGRPEHAGPGDVAQRHRVLGQHAHRGPPARVPQRRHQPAGGPGGRRRGHPPGHDPVVRARGPAASARLGGPGDGARRLGGPGDGAATWPTNVVPLVAGQPANDASPAPSAANGAPAELSARVAQLLCHRRQDGRELADQRDEEVVDRDDPRQLLVLEHREPARRRGPEHLERLEHVDGALNGDRVRRHDRSRRRPWEAFPPRSHAR